MRLGQLARKYNIPAQEIIDFLEEKTGETFHPNAKLYDTIEASIFKHFDLYPILEDENEPEKEDETQLTFVDKEIESLPTKLDIPTTPEEEIALLGGELETLEKALPSNVDVATHAIEDQEKPKENEIIQTDQLLEMLDDETDAAELDKIKLIKAPKRSLAGLTVVGKVDLPEPKKKEASQEKQPARKQHNRRPQLSEAEKERRRLKAKRKKEAFEARQEKRQKAEASKKQKERKTAHYQQKFDKPEVKNQKLPIQHEESTSVDAPAKPTSRPEPKTWLGKWWRWMNT